MKDLLRQVFATTLRRLDAARATRQAVAATLPPARTGPCLVIALGKAARPMAQGLLAALPGVPLRGLVVPPEPDDAPLPPFEVIAGGHPLPTQGSLRAAARALELARGVRRDETAVFLISGGGSALCEAPIDPGVPLLELRTLYRALIGCGAPIVDVNTVRRHLSALKGGRLAAAAAAAARRLTFSIRDVPLDARSTLSSGPTEPDWTTHADCRAVLDRHRLWPAVPALLRERLRTGDLPAPVTLADLATTESVTVQDPRWPVAIAARALAQAAVVVTVDESTDDWPYRRAADHLLGRLERLRRRHAGRPVAIVAGGELSVPLPAAPGTGGRNQQFALHCARLIRGRPIAVLSCGTDGIDGSSPAAGAVVDGTTMARARRRGLDVHAHLARCDAFPLLHALGDTVCTGPTGTNVRDLRLCLHA